MQHPLVIMICLVNSNLSDSVSVTWTFVRRSDYLSFAMWTGCLTHYRTLIAFLLFSGCPVGGELRLGLGPGL